MKKHLLITSIMLLGTLISLAQWQPDVRLTNDPSPSYTSANNARCIASNGNNIHVVWNDYRIGNSSRIFYKRSTDGGISWQDDINLSTINQTSTNPSIAISGSDVHVVWDDDRISLSNREIYYRHSTDNGITWGPEVRLSSLPDDSYESSISVSGQLVIVVWQDGIWGALEVYCKRSTDAGATWGADTRLTNNTGYSASPSTCINGQIVHLIWGDDSDGNEEIYYKRSTDGGVSWGADTRLTNNPAIQRYPSISISGNAVHLVWFDDRDGGGYNTEIYYKKSSDGGINWGPDTRLTNNPGYSAIPSVFASGTAVHVVWYDERDGNDEIYYKRSIDGGTSWEPDTRLTNNTSESINPSLTVSGSSVHVLWQDRRDGTYPEIYYKRNPTGDLVGLKELSSSEMQFTVFPNPASSEIKIRSLENINELSITDMYGKELYYSKVLNSTTELRIPTSDFPAGLYFIRVRQENRAGVQKLIKL